MCTLGTPSDIVQLSVSDWYDGEARHVSFVALVFLLFTSVTTAAAAVEKTGRQEQAKRSKDMLLHVFVCCTNSSVVL